jgi:hypothetical protein
VKSIETRSAQACELWRRGAAACCGGDDALACRAYSGAHDLVTDCAALHRQAHRKLRRVTRGHANKFEFVTDSLVRALAPSGVFEGIARARRTRAGRAVVGRARGARAGAVHEARQ